MAAFNDGPILEPSSSADGNVEDVHDLMEEGWFFGKLLLRCSSDPTPKFDDEPGVRRRNSCARKDGGQLVHAPSLPPFVGREDGDAREQDNGRTCPGGSKLTRQLSDLTLARKPTKPASTLENKEHGNARQDKPSNLTGLRRAPSLPVYFGREEGSEYGDDDDDEGDEISMSRLIRQAIPSALDGSRPRRNGKDAMQIPKHRPPRGSSSADKCYPKETGNMQPKPGTLRKTLSNLEYHEVQGFRDLGFSFTKEDLNPSVAALIQGIGNEEQEQVTVRKRPDFYEPLSLKTCATPIRIWAGKSSDEDMKTQLKFWARAVASNVR